MMGDGTNLVRTDNVLSNYSVIYLNATKQQGVLFRCATGLGPSSNNTNDVIGNLYFNNMLLTKGNCSGFVQAEGARNFTRFPGVFNARVCGERTLTNSTEGIYTCTLTNSDMMNQSMSVGVYFSGRSKSFHDG